MMLWFVLTLELSARLQITRKCICSDWKTLEKTSRQIYKQILALKEFSQSIVFLFSRRLGFKFQTVLYLTYLRIPTNPNYHMPIKKSQAILKHFIDLKFRVSFTLCSARKTKPCFVTLRTFFSFLFPLSPFPTHLGKIEATLLAGYNAGHLLFWQSWPAVDLKKV